jgi:pilus assembly protein CpaE
MSEQPIVVLLGATPSRELSVRSALADLTPVQTDPTLLAVPSTRARIAIVDLGVGDAEGPLSSMEELARSVAQLQIVALASKKDPDLILRAMHAGAREFVVLDKPVELLRVVGDLMRRGQTSEAVGTIVSLFSAKGGLGSTALAANLAGALAEGGNRVVLVDLDLQLGGVLVFLDMASRYTLAEVLHNLKRLDRDLLLTSLAQHSSGIYVLSQSDHLDEADKVSPQQVATLLPFLARHFDYVVCDGLRGFDEMTLATLDVSQQVLLLLQQDVPSIKNAQRCLEVFHRLGYPKEKVRLVCNRYQRGDKIDLQSIGDNLGIPVQTTVANDYRAMIGAINRGVLLAKSAPRSRATDDLRKLANAVAGGLSRPRRAGLLRALFGRRQEPIPKVQPAGRPTPAHPVSGAAMRRSEHEPARAPETV